jgi:hypothetical protein
MRWRHKPTQPNYTAGGTIQMERRRSISNQRQGYLDSLKVALFRCRQGNPFRFSEFPENRDCRKTVFRNRKKLDRITLQQLQRRQVQQNATQE